MIMGKLSNRLVASQGQGVSEGQGLKIDAATTLLLWPVADHWTPTACPSIHAN